METIPKMWISMVLEEDEESIAVPPMGSFPIIAFDEDALIFAKLRCEEISRISNQKIYMVKFVRES